jgi:hypothetical protein
MEDTIARRSGKKNLLIAGSHMIHEEKPEVWLNTTDKGKKDRTALK